MKSGGLCCYNFKSDQGDQSYFNPSLKHQISHSVATPHLLERGGSTSKRRDLKPQEPIGTTKPHHYAHGHTPETVQPVAKPGKRRSTKYNFQKDEYISMGLISRS